MSIHRDISQAAELLTRCSNEFPQRFKAMQDAQAGQPGAQSYEQSRTTGHATVLDEHGVPMPSVSDPTGEAAMLRVEDKDRAAIDEDETRRLVSRLSRDTDKLSRLLADYPLKPHEAGSIARRETEAANRKDPGCEQCATVGRWTAPHVEESDVKRNLDRGYRLCVWCWRFVLDFGRLPNETELRSHHDGKKLRRPA